MNRDLEFRNILREIKMENDFNDNLRASAVILASAILSSKSVKTDHLGLPIHSCTCGQPCTHTLY